MHAPDIKTPLPGPKARAIIERDARFVSPSYTRDYPFVIARGEGAVVEDVDEYRRRSPVFWAAKLKTPLLVHATTNDRDVNVIETENLVAALKAAGKEFEVRIYKDAPAGHSFNRIDTGLAKESRKEIWAFLERHLGK